MNESWTEYKRKAFNLLESTPEKMDSDLLDSFPNECDIFEGRVRKS